jgi:hypothetical protein
MTTIQEKTGEIVENFRKVCCRCELNLSDEQHVLGGLYNGVVCVKHRSCTSCWFTKFTESNDKQLPGKRSLEVKETKLLPLVDSDKLLKNLFNNCLGCKKKIPPYNDPNYVIDLSEYDSD